MKELFFINVFKDTEEEILKAQEEIEWEYRNYDIASMGGIMFVLNKGEKYFYSAEISEKE